MVASIAQQVVNVGRKRSTKQEYMEKERAMMQWCSCKSRRGEKQRIVCEQDEEGRRRIWLTALETPTFDILASTPCILHQYRHTESQHVSRCRVILSLWPQQCYVRLIRDYSLLLSGCPRRVRPPDNAPCIPEPFDSTQQYHSFLPLHLACLFSDVIGPTRDVAATVLDLRHVRLY